MKKLFKRIKNNKLLRYTGVGIIFLLLLLVGRVTYAYFAADINAAQGNVVAGNDTVDAIKFEVGDPLSLNVNSNTLPENGTNLVTNTTTKARLLANSTTNEATYTYYVYLNLTDNTFVYTKENTPEIILSVVDPNGNEVTDISGLTYGTFNGVAGFDVTTYEGMILLSQFSITSASSTEETIQEWSITLTYLNQPYDQTVNFGHSLKTEMLMKKDRFTLANYIINLAGTTQGTNNIYHHDNDLENSAQDGSYRYSGRDYVIASKSSYNFEDIIISENINGALKYYLVYDSTKTYYNSVNDALKKTITDGYIEQKSLSNYVCFGSDEETCPYDNLYRIIGVFGDNVKLIKADYANSNILGTNGEFSSLSYLKTDFPQYVGKLENIDRFYFNFNNPDVNYGASNGSSSWNTSLLNLVNLNANFLTKIGTDWTNKIANYKWNLGGVTGNVQMAPKSFFDKEKAYLSNPSKIGLVTPSEYGFASSQNSWSNNMNTKQFATINNWLHLGLLEWTMTPYYGDCIFEIAVDGGSYATYANNTFAIRPTFYLNSNVTYVSGTGTETNPYRID